MSERADLKSPCVFCAYAGPRYWQAFTHHSLCPWYKLAGVNDRKNALREVIHSLLVQDGLRKAAQAALEHLGELREAWQRGVIDERDGHSPKRSNRNVEVETNLRMALYWERPAPVTPRPEGETREAVLDEIEKLIGAVEGRHFAAVATAAREDDKRRHGTKAAFAMELRAAIRALKQSPMNSDGLTK